MQIRRRILVALPIMVGLVATPVNPADAWRGGPKKVPQAGVVQSGQDGIPHAKVTIYEAGRSKRSARALGSTRANSDGYFSVRYRAPSRGAVLYLIADGRGHQSKVRFATVLGQGPYPDHIVINERTTVATAYAMAQFIDGKRLGGPRPGMPNAASIVQNIADVATGEIGARLSASPNGGETSALPTVNTLANMLAACVEKRRACRRLFNAARPSRGKRPSNTLDAMVDIAHNPGHNVPKLMAISLLQPTYLPALPPEAVTDMNDDDFINSWVLALRYIGDGSGQGLDGPGNIAFDSHGNAWVNNNYAFSESRTDITCGSTAVMKLTPTGGDAPGAPYGGDDTVGDGADAGGLYGAGFGIAVDGNDGAWVTSFGFQCEPLLNPSPKPRCENDPAELAINVAQFAEDGTTLSPDGDLSDPTNQIAGGYQGLGTIDLPQGVQVDRDGNVWVASCGNGQVTKFVDGDPTHAVDRGDIGIDQAFDLAIDRRGHVWVTGNKSLNVVELDKSGFPLGEVTGFSLPMGIASDSAGNLWVSDAGLPAPPCPARKESPEIGEDGAQNVAAAVSLIEHSGDQRVATRYGKNDDPDHPRDGLRWPWGISVDGADNVWVANFTGQTIMHLCGAANANCPKEHETGDPISPDSGYMNNALERVTATQIDPSGNVWMTNNWIVDAFRFPENPGGYHVVLFVGLAAPVKTPMAGPPRRP